MNITPINTNNTLNHGAVAIEQSRAITEAQGKLLLAKQFPRDENDAYLKVMKSCARQSMAESAIYSYPRGGQTVSGASIRLAEEIARSYGNIEYGIRELSSSDGESEMEAYAWDLQTNTISSQKFKVKHMRDKRGGGVKLTDSRDIYELTANMGARRLRARLLAVLPPYLVDDAVIECRKTIQGDRSIPVEDRARKMVLAFEKIGVSKSMIESKLNHEISNINHEEIADMMGIYNSIKSNQTSRDEWFEVPRVNKSPIESKNGDFKMEQVGSAPEKTADFDRNGAVKMLVDTKKKLLEDVHQKAIDILGKGDPLFECMAEIRSINDEATSMIKAIDSEEKAKESYKFIKSIESKCAEIIKSKNGGSF